MTLRSTSVNLGNPGAIGGTTPGEITGTTITANTKFVATTGTVTADTPTYSATQTWNNAAITFTGYKINITDTASAGGSLLMDLQVGGVSKDNTDKNGNKTLLGRIITSDGTPTAPTYSFTTDNSYGLSFFAGNQIAVSLAGERKMRFLQGGGLAVASDMRFAWSGTTDASASADDLMLYRDAANTLAQRNGANSQTFRVGPSTGYAVVGNTGIGYATGLGGVVTQLTNKSTGVTLNTVTGEITMNAAALAANTTVSFTLTNSTIAATDLVLITHDSAGTAGAYTVTAQGGAGTANIAVRNVTAGSLSEAIVLKFAVFKAVNS